MGAPILRGAPTSPERTRRESDLYTWVQEQVALLRAGRLDEVDAANIAEELADVGRSEFAKLQSALEVVLTHMRKWDRQPGKRTRSWANSIAVQRNAYADVLADNPGLKPRRGEVLTRAYRRARLDASSETNRPVEDFPVDCPYDWSNILDRSFTYEPPARPGRGRA